MIHGVVPVLLGKRKNPRTLSVALVSVGLSQTVGLKRKVETSRLSGPSGSFLLGDTRGFTEAISLDPKGTHRT